MTDRHIKTTLAQHELEVRAVCDVYATAAQLAADGVRVVSCDENTGIQALERDAPTKPTRAGVIERREFEYIRHGTSCLIASFDVVTGKIVVPTLGPTRDEKDFAIHVLHVVASDPTAKWVFVVDNLTTHVSETLVRIVASREGLDIDLGLKGSRGILKNVATRRAFLVDTSHQIRFVYTPKHCSWLNQIECWFSICWWLPCTLTSSRRLRRGLDFSPSSFERRLRRDQRGRKAAAPLETPRLWGFVQRSRRNHEGRGRASLFVSWSMGRSRS